MEPFNIGLQIVRLFWAVFKRLLSSGSCQGDRPNEGQIVWQFVKVKSTFYKPASD